jgi:hypothetical protein
MKPAYIRFAYAVVAMPQKGLQDVVISGNWQVQCYERPAIEKCKPCGSTVQATMHTAASGCVSDYGSNRSCPRNEFRCLPVIEPCFGLQLSFVTQHTACRAHRGTRACCCTTTLTTTLQCLLRDFAADVRSEVDHGVCNDHCRTCNRHEGRMCSKKHWMQCSVGSQAEHCSHCTTCPDRCGVRK